MTFSWSLKDEIGPSKLGTPALPSGSDAGGGGAGDNDGSGVGSSAGGGTGKVTVQAEVFQSGDLVIDPKPETRNPKPGAACLILDP